MHTISLALHVTAAAVLVGPQVLMFFAVVPATWIIEDDERLKRALLGVVARRFGMMSVFAIVTLVVTGIYQYALVIREHAGESPSDYRFGPLFTTKMALFALLLVLILVHTYRFSRRIMRLSDAVIAGEGDAGELERARLQSFTFSVAILAVSVMLLWLGVALADDSYAWVPR